MSQSAENTPLKYQGQQSPARKHLAANMGKEASLQSSINIWISKMLIQNIRTRFSKDFKNYFNKLMKLATMKEPCLGEFLWRQQ